MIYRVIDKATGLFIEDKFEFNPETEIGLDVSPAQGLYLPKWNGTEWVEGATELPAPTPTEPTLEERLAVVEDDTEAIAIVLADIVGVEV